MTGNGFAPQEEHSQRVAIAPEVDIEHVEWIVHGDIFSVIPGTRKLECPVCGITGELDIVDGELQVSFTEDAIFHSRMNLGGIIDHCVELHGNEDPIVMEMFGDKTWVKPRNFGEEMKEAMAFEKEVLENGI